MFRSIDNAGLLCIHEPITFEEIYLCLAGTPLALACCCGSAFHQHPPYTIELRLTDSYP